MGNHRVILARVALDDPFWGDVAIINIQPWILLNP